MSRNSFLLHDNIYDFDVSQGFNRDLFRERCLATILKTISADPLRVIDSLGRGLRSSEPRQVSRRDRAYLWRRNVPRPRRALTYPPIITL